MEKTTGFGLRISLAILARVVPWEKQGVCETVMDQKGVDNEAKEVEIGHNFLMIFES